MKLGYKERLGLLIAGQLALLAGVAAFSYAPSVSAIRETEETLRQLSEKQAKLHQVLEASPNPDAAIARTKEQIAQLENRMPPEARVGWVSAQIVELMNTHHVDLQSATNWNEDGKPSPEAELKRLAKRVTVHGSAQNLQAFLEDVNQLPFVVIIEEVLITRGKRSGSVLADLRLATFVLRGRGTVAASGGREGTS